jgi:hypothetical protein
MSAPARTTSCAELQALDFMELRLLNTNIEKG